MPMPEEIPCSSCDKPATWAVTLPYDDEDKAGHLLAYCDTCRHDDSKVAASIPLELVDEDMFVGLYAGGFTRSNPGIATAVLFGEEMPTLAERARRVLPPD
jgi:hypothetical protein